VYIFFTVTLSTKTLSSLALLYDSGSWPSLAGLRDHAQWTHDVGFPWTRDKPEADTLPDDTQHPKLSINIVYFIYRITYFRSTCFDNYCRYNHTYTHTHARPQYMFIQSTTPSENLLRILIECL